MAEPSRVEPPLPRGRGPRWRPPRRRPIYSLESGGIGPGRARRRPVHREQRSFLLGGRYLLLGADVVVRQSSKYGLSFRYKPEFEFHRVNERVNGARSAIDDSRSRYNRDVGHDIANR